MLPMVNPESEARMDIISATPLRRDDIMAKSVENAIDDTRSIPNGDMHNCFMFSRTVSKPIFFFKR